MRLKEKLLFFNYFFWTVNLPLVVVGMAVGGGVKRLVCVTTTPLAEVTIFMDVEGTGTLLAEEEMVLIPLDKEDDEVVVEDGEGPNDVGVTLGDSMLGDTVTFIIKFNAVNEKNERKKGLEKNIPYNPYYRYFPAQAGVFISQNVTQPESLA